MIRPHPVHIDGLLHETEIVPARDPLFPFAGAQTADFYPQQRLRSYWIERGRWQPRLKNRTAWTNLFTRAHTPAHADWSKTNLTATDSVVANPENGLTTAARLLESSATGEHKLTRTSAPTFTAANHAVDFCAKALGDRWLRLHTNDGTEDYEAWFHPTSGAWKYFADVINATTLNGNFATAGGGGGDVFANWTEGPTGSTALVRDTVTVLSGDTASCRMDIDGSANYGALEQDTLRPGRRYRATFWARNSGGTAAARIYDFPLGVVYYTTPALTTDWSYHTVEFTAVRSQFALMSIAGAGESLWLARVTLTPLDPQPLISATTLNGNFATAGGGGGDVFANWTEGPTGSTALVRDTVTVLSGDTASCRMDIDGSANYGALEQDTLRPGRRYRATFWARNSGGTAAARIYDFPLGVVYYTTPALTTDWSYHTVEFTAVRSQFALMSIAGAGESLWLARVTLTPLDLPIVTMLPLPWPAEGWYRCSFIAPHRAATGSWTLALSSDGTTLSYAGNTAVGAYVWGLGLYAASSLGPIVETLGSTRTVSAPDIDAADPFAYLAAESEPQPAAGDLLRVERTFARLPATQTRRDYQTFSRPNPSGRRSSTTYAANVDGDDSFRLWTARKAVLGYQNTPGGTSSNNLPSGNISITLTSGHSVSFAANAGQATIQAAVNTNIVGVGKLLNCTVAWSSSIVTFWLTYYVGGATIASFTVPSGTTAEQTSSYLRATAFGTTITPDTKLIHCPSHGAAAGELAALWNSHALVARGTVAGVSNSDYLSLVLSDLDSPDFSFTALTLGDDATVRYASGPARINVSIATDYYLPGVSMLSSGSTLNSLSDLPAVTTYTSEQRWLDRLVAAATTVPIDATQLDAYLGPIASRATVTAIMDDKVLESLTLT